MIILLISCMKGLGGTERSTQTLAELLISRGHEIHLLGARGPLCEDIEQLGVKYFDLETHSTNLAENAKFFTTLNRLIKTYKYDCIHLQMARPTVITVLAKLFAGSQTKIIWHSRGIAARTYMYIPRIFSFMGIRAIGNCQAEQKKLIRYGFDKKRVGFLYNPCRIEQKIGSRTQFRAKYGFQSNDFVIGSLSRLHPTRGVNYAIEYFSELCELYSQKDRLFLLIAGEGKERANLMSLAAKSPASERIKFIGGIKNTEDFYAGIDLFWNPVAFIGDESAGTGNTVIEAAFQKVPTVSHDWGGVNEIVIDGETGALSPVADRKTFVKKTLDLITNIELRNKIITQALLHVSNLVSSQACVEKVEKYYLEL